MSGWSVDVAWKTPMSERGFWYYDVQAFTHVPKESTKDIYHIRVIQHVDLCQLNMPVGRAIHSSAFAYRNPGWHYSSWSELAATWEDGLRNPSRIHFLRLHAQSYIHPLNYSLPQCS